MAPGVWMSPGLTNSYLLTTDDGRIVVNTGMGFESPVHKANFDAVDDGPVRYIIYTQGHADHVGGTDVFREPGTHIVAQANWEMWRDDTERLLAHRARNTMFAFVDKISATVAGIQTAVRRGPARAGRSRPRHDRRGHPLARGRRPPRRADRHPGRRDHRLAGGVAAR